MSTRRKLRRAAKSRNPAPVRPEPERPESSQERFKRPGSEKLWKALLGWKPERLLRIHLADALHDAALRQDDVTSVHRQMAEAQHELPATVSDAELSSLIASWQSAVGAEASAAHWQALAALVEQAGMGQVSADELLADWQIWTSLRRASPRHKALLEALRQTDEVAQALDEYTNSENVAAVSGVLRALWMALAYGDEAGFQRIVATHREWQKHEPVPPGS